MRFRVYGVMWGGGAPDPLDALKRFVADTPKLLRPVFTLRWTLGDGAGTTA